MSVGVAAAIKAAILALTDESTRKKIGWVLVAILSPIIVIVALICSIFSATSQQNVSTVELCFHGGTISSEVAPEYRQYVLEMRESFSTLDSMVEEINSLLEDGESLDANRVKAIFYVLYFGAQQPDEVGLQSFVDCFVTYTEGIRTVIDTDQEGNEVEAEETYQIPHLVDDLSQIYERIGEATGVTATPSHQANADNIYNQLGDYTAQQTAANTVRDGLEKLLGRDRVVYSRGCTVRGGDRSEIAAAVSAARGTDAAVVVIGGSSARDFDTEFLQTGAAKAAHDEVRDMECGEGFDRATLALLGEQEELLRRIKATGTPLIVVCIAGRPLDLRRASEQADALLMAWYPGARGGDAVAETILGRNNPAGRLPITIPRAEGQIPVYYNKKRPANHDYTDLTAAPLYPFGYGLSYSTFEYGSLEARQSGDNVLEVSCRIRNTSDREGDEVVQLYISDMVASTVRPPRQLGGFRRIRLAPGEQRQVSFTLGDEALALIDPQGRRVVEKGDFVIAVGSSSQDIRLQTTVTLE